MKRGFPEKSVVSKLARKFLALYGSRRFITAFAWTPHFTSPESNQPSVHAFPFPF